MHHLSVVPWVGIVCLLVYGLVHRSMMHRVALVFHHWFVHGIVLAGHMLWG